MTHLAVQAEPALPLPRPETEAQAREPARAGAGLRQRGSLTVWFTDQATEGWRVEPRTPSGGQPWRPSLAILTGLTLRAALRLALRRTQGLVGSIIRLPGRLLGLALAVAASVVPFTGDDAHDREGASTAVAERRPAAAAVVPPRSTAVPGRRAGTHGPRPHRPIPGQGRADRAHTPNPRNTAARVRAFFNVVAEGIGADWLLTEGRTACDGG